MEEVMKGFECGYSIIMPVYNNESIIKSVISKLEKLSNCCEDIIVIDDCSTDKTNFLINHFIQENSLGERIRLFSNEVNQGPAFSRNIGIKMSKMEYIAFLDSDDDWHPQKVECQILLMKKYGASVSGTLHKAIAPSDLVTLSNIKTEPYNIEVEHVNWPKVLFKSPFSTPSVVMKNGLDTYFNENLRCSEDFNLWIRLSKKHKVIRLEEFLTYTFKHDYLSDGGSLSSNLFAMQKGELSNFIDILRTISLTRFDAFIVICAMFFSCLKLLRRLLFKLLC